MAFSFNQPQQQSSPYNLGNAGSWFAGQNMSGHGRNPMQEALRPWNLGSGDKFNQNVTQGLTGAMLPGVLQGIQFGNDMAPMRYGMAANAISMLDPRNNQAKVDRHRKRALATSDEEARRIGLIMQEQGMGSGAQAAMQLAGMNSANSSTNNFASQIESPEYAMQNQQAIQQIIDMASQSPYLQAILQMTGRQQQQQQSSGGGGLLGTLAGLAGTAAGLGWSPFG